MRFAGAVTTQPTDPRTMADALLAAERDRTPIRAVHPAATRSSTPRDGYAAQALVVEHRLQAGEQVDRVKLGLTSKVKRDALGIHEPVFGRLTSGMLRAARRSRCGWPS